MLFYPISGPRGFHYLINLYFLYSYSTQLETGKPIARGAAWTVLVVYMVIFFLGGGGIVIIFYYLILLFLYMYAIICELVEDKDTIRCTCFKNAKKQHRWKSFLKYE